MRAIAEGVWTDEAEPRLIGGVEVDTGRVVFPCPPGDRYEPRALSRTGTLWSYTIQRFRPKSPPYAGPEAFRPWAVGYVELPGEVIVESRIVNVAFEDIRIGMPLEMTLVPLDPEATDPVLIHAFQPTGAAA